MKILRQVQSLSTSLSPQFDTTIQTIELKDKPFASGGFGALYFCQSINNISLPQPQVVKIFYDEENTLKGFQTIQKLQENVIQLNQYKKSQNLKLVQEYNALFALPQLSFKATLDNETVYGYLSHRLNRNEFTEFDRIIEDEKVTQEYYTLPFGQKVKYALDMVEGFQVLRELNYIHADINAENLFIGLQKATSIIIDYDSGAVMLNAQDSPNTWGKPNEWVAPEIASQLSAQKEKGVQTVKVNLLSDMWSVAVGIHYLLFLKHPFFYLNELSERSMKAYFQQHRWPYCDTSATYFNTNITPFYEKYVQLIEKALPADITKRLSTTFNEGFYNPALRSSYNTWVTALKPHALSIETEVQALSIPKEPEIELKPISRRKPVPRQNKPHHVVAQPITRTPKHRTMPTQGYAQGQSPTQHNRQQRQTPIQYSKTHQKIMAWDVRKVALRLGIVFVVLLTSIIIAINWGHNRISDAPKLRYYGDSPSEFVESKGQNHEVIKNFVAPTQTITSLAVNPEGTKVFTVSEDNNIYSWDITSGNLVNTSYAQTNNLKTIAINPKKPFFATPYLNHQIAIWDIHTNQVLQVYQGHKKTINSLAFSSDGTLLASGDIEGNVYIWDLRSNKKVMSWFIPTHYEVLSLRFHPKESMIVIGSSDKNVYLWEFNEKKTTTFRGAILAISSVDFTPDGSRILAGGYDKTLRIWDTRTHEEIRTLWRTHNSEILCAKYSPNGKYIASSSKDKTIRLLDAQTGKMITIFNEDKEVIYGLAFSPDNQYLFTGGENKTVRMWKMPS